ncbi:MAG: 4,5-DOPA dioxygenase extradiol [Bacteriovoracaceae bacterium]|nr:4,5-DOPA dioxygenase extradiol [Bacteriovoracaceae bacterium]
MSALKINSLNELGELFSKKHQAKVLPALFLGHGSPMNAIDDNRFTRFLNALGKDMTRPEAILVISAHWMTEGTWITHMERPKTIHDFYGFPQPLFDVQYPAPGRPDIAEAIQKEIVNPQIQLDHEAWGLDHGTWSVLRHLYPEADIPVMQLSVYMTQPPEYHMKLGQELAKLREKGVLIVASGNIVHNLRRIRWEHNVAPYDWAIEFDEWIKQKLLARDFKALQNDFLNTEAGKLSNPSLDHYYPLLYILGASNNKDELRFEYEEIQNASVSMRCFSFGRV